MECGGPQVCPTGAFIWDETNQTLKVDNSKCTSCGICAKECPIEAIIVVKTEEEFKEVKKKIEEDPRTKAELFIERYGAKVTNSQIVANSDNFDEALKEREFVGVEFWNNNSISCLLFSVPYSKLTMDCNIAFKKINADENKELAEKYGVNELPTLVIFKNGEPIGKVKGKFKIDQEEKLKEKIREILG